MGHEYGNAGGVQKKTECGGRAVTTPLFLLRAVQLGLIVTDLDLLTIGMIIDMHTEALNERESPDRETEATQEDLDNF